MDNILIGFRVAQSSDDLNDPKTASPFGDNEPLEVFYEGKHPFDSLVAHVHFEREKYEKINFLKPKVSGLVANELVTGLLRCGMHTVVMSTYHNQMLLFNDWKCTRVLDGPDMTNMRSF